MRKVIILSVIGLPLLLLLSVYATPLVAPTWTVRLRNAHGFTIGDPVEEAGQRIGRVVGVAEAPGGAGVDILITLNAGFRDRLRERSTFLVITTAGSTRPALSLVVFDENSPPLPPGTQLTGAESAMEVEIRRQMLVMEGAVQELASQLDTLGQSLDRASRSEESQRLEEGVGSLFETLRQTRDDVTDVLTREIERWKNLSEKLFPPERVPPERDKPA